MPNGSIKHIEVVAHAVEGHESGNVGFVGAVLDVTERKQAEQKFRGLLESAPDAMIVMSRQGKIVLVNAQVESCLGISGKNSWDGRLRSWCQNGLGADTPNTATGFFAQPRVRPMGADLELYGRRKDGTEFPVESASVRWRRRRARLSPCRPRHHRAQARRGGTA